jgi:enterochelin esterase family protein
MIVVMPNGNPNTSAAPLSRGITESEQAGIGSMASGRFEESLVSDIIPFVEANFRALQGAEHRALSGFSMGGFQTQNISNAHPEMFQYLGVMSMGLFSAFNAQTGGNYDRDAHIRQLQALKSAGPKLYWIGMGNKDFLFQTGVKLRELYDEVGLTYEYLENEGTHDWNSWRLYLTTLVPKFFK